MATRSIYNYPRKYKTAQESMKCLRRFVPLDADPKTIYADNLLDFTKACEDENWNQEISGPHGSETNGKRHCGKTARRVEVVTSSSLFVRSALHER